MSEKMLKGRYKIIEKIGEGGMAKVYKGHDELLNRNVAIKILKEEFINNSEIVQRFEKEGQAAASLSHPNIINVYDVGEETSIKYIVMELMTGQTLKEYIYNNDLSDQEIIKIGQEIASALSHAHKNNIIHRDIKPENIIIDDRGGLKVTDFGIARAVMSSKTIVNTKTTLGSVHYTSPEQARGGVIDERTDIYSLGILLYEMATKELPFSGETEIEVALKHLKEKALSPKEINDDMSTELEQIILKAIEKNPNDRYTNVKSLMKDLKAIEGNNRSNKNNSNEFSNETKKLPDIGDEAMKKKKNNKPDGFVILLVIFGALILSLGIFTLLYWDDFTQSLENEVVVVPNITNLTRQEAIKELETLGLNVELRENYSDTIKKGYIIKQSIAAGKEVKKDYTIEIVVSQGGKLIETPNVIHKEFIDGKIKIENMNLVVGNVRYEYNELPKDSIISQSPDAGTKIKENSKINLVVSKGAETNTVLMPNILGLTIQEATDRLNKINLKLGSISYIETSTYENDQIAEQSVPVSEEIEEGTLINVVIAKNNATDETDEQEENETSSDETTKEETTLKEATYFIPLNFSEESTVVKIEKVVDNAVEVVYEKEHQKSEKSIRVTITGSEKAIIKIYFGDQLINTKIEDFE